MFKSTITRMAASAFIGAVLTFGAVQATRGAEVYTDHYMVLNKIVYPDGTTTCETRLSDHVLSTISKYTEVGPGDDICVITVGLTIDAVEQLPEELGDTLQGIYPATDNTGKAIEFSAYLPSIHTTK